VHSEREGGREGGREGERERRMHAYISIRGVPSLCRGGWQKLDTPQREDKITQFPKSKRDQMTESWSNM